MRVLLLNPPGERIYIRDYFCSKTTKSNYLYQPIDLVMMSGTLASEHDVQVMDCIAEGLSAEAAHQRIARWDPQVIISLVGSVSWEEDRIFLADEHARGRRILASGDILREDSVTRLAEEPWLEAAIMAFATADPIHYLRGDVANIEDMTLRGPDGQPRRHNPVPQRGSYSLPMPRHDLFPTRGYRFSFARRPGFATLLTDWGCPYPCTFCVMGTLGFKTRAVDAVLEEIDALRAAGRRELFFLDQTFGVVKDRGLALCDALAARGDLSWTAYTRPDVATDAMLEAMKRGGCHTVIMGVESPDDAQLRAYRKGYTTDVVREAFRRARRHRLRTVGTFVIGHPDEGPDTLERTLRYAIELDMDYMSLNMAVPRFGTPFRREILAAGLASAGDLVMDQGGADAFLDTRHLDRAAMLRAKQRMIRRFYLRPRYLARRLSGVGSLYELRAQVREGLALLRRNV